MRSASFYSADVGGSDGGNAFAMCFRAWMMEVMPMRVEDPEEVLFRRRLANGANQTLPVAILTKRGLVSLCRRALVCMNFRGLISSNGQVFMQCQDLSNSSNVVNRSRQESTNGMH